MNLSVTDSGSVFQLVHTVERESPVVDVFANESALSVDDLTDAISKGAMWRSKGGHGKIRRMSQTDQHCLPGDVVYLNFNPGVLAEIPMQARLVSDEHNYSVWHKPSGMPSQGSKWADHCSITRVVASTHNKKALLVHRLDKAASGLIIVAHTQNAVRALTAMFAKREIEKRYDAIVKGQFSMKTPVQFNDAIEGKACKTEVLNAVHDSSNNTSALLINLHTGRKHQIRKHLSKAGFPIVGDRLYAEDQQHSCNLQLLASELSFECPFTQQRKHFRTSWD